MVETGTDTRVLSHVNGDTKKIDLEGKTVIPGFIDTHVHGASLGSSLSQINLRHTHSIDEIKRIIREKAKKTARGEWIIGRGWDQDKLIEHRYPTRFDLDQAAPNHPVFLLRTCGHLGLINSKAMKLAKIRRKTRSPDVLKVQACPSSLLTILVAVMVLSSYLALSPPSISLNAIS